jgi:tight adherence protein B
VSASALLAAALVAVVAAHLPRRAVGPRRAGGRGERRRLRRFATDRRRRRPDEVAVAAWCDEVARRVRAGASLTGAVDTASGDVRVAHALEPLRLALHRGASLADATDPGMTSTGASGRAWSLALGSVHAAAVLGGPAADVLEATAAVLRARHADLAERRVHAAQAGMSTVVLTVLPLVGLVLAVAASAAVRGAVTSGPGAACVAAGVVLNAAGWWWSRRILVGADPS